MCATCGCDEESGVRISALMAPRPDPTRVDHGPVINPGTPRPVGRGVGRGGVGTYEDPAVGPHNHSAAGSHDHGAEPVQPTSAPGQRISIETDLLAKNDGLAAHNREWLTGRGILALNLMSSPGSGKTTLLERTIREVGPELSVSVIEGDQETTRDAERIRATGADVVQINTGSGCHLDADMLHRGLHALDPQAQSLVFVENVGNLVCPALFDLGESAKVVIISVTEGDDKPLKYPQMFAAADLVIINKTDLLAYVEFDLDRCSDHARSLRPGIEILSLSATKGDGVDAWYGWLRDLRQRRGSRGISATRM